MCRACKCGSAQRVAAPQKNKVAASVAATLKCTTTTEELPNVLSPLLPESELFTT